MLLKIVHKYSVTKYNAVNVNFMTVAFSNLNRYSVAVN